MPGTDDLSEAEFLDLQAQRAKAEFTRSLEALKQSLGTAVDLRLWAQHHPWLTVGAAAAAGFAAGSTITSAISGEPEPSRNGYASTQQAAGPPPAAQAGAAPRQHSALWNSLIGPLFDLAKVAIQSSIASAMGGAMQAQAQEAAQNGHPAGHEQYADASADAVSGAP
jgi:hypothetical protein